MINKIDITGRKNYQVSEDLSKYIRSKIGKLDKYMSRRARKSVSAEVKLTEGDTKTKNRNTCEVILHLPGDRLTATESTINMFAAVDIVEAKLKNQLRRLKEKSDKAKKADRKGSFRRIRAMASKDYWGSQN